MVTDLPGAIADYFAADEARNAEAVARCFTGAGMVQDDGETYSGQEAIRRWKADSSQKYTYTAQPVS